MKTNTILLFLLFLPINLFSQIDCCETHFDNTPSILRAGETYKSSNRKDF